MGRGEGGGFRMGSTCIPEIKKKKETKRGKMQTISEYYYAHGTDLTNPLKEVSLNHTLRIATLEFVAMQI